MMPYTEWIGFQNRRKERAKRRTGNMPVETVPDPATVQEKYNQQKTVWADLVGPMATAGGTAVLMATGTLMTAMSAGLSVLQSFNVPIALLPVGMMAVFAVSRGVGFLMERNAVKQEGEVAIPEHLADDHVPTWATVAFLYPMMGGMVAMIVLLLFPPLRGMLSSLAPNAIQYCLGGVFALVIIASIGIGRYTHRLTHYSLPADHYAHRIIAELTHDTAVRVRRVEVARSPSLNAYVTIWRTMSFTSRLLREFSPDELRVVIAHEVGHFRAADPARHALIGLLITASFLGVWLGGRAWLESHYTLSVGMKAALNSPMFSIFLLPMLQSLLMGKTRRRAEEAADRFAVDAMQGSGEFVIQTLTKLHTLNATPHRLKPSDEILSTHPSLANRAAAIRRYVGGVSV